MAVAFVASPFYIRQAIAAFEAVDPTLVDAARSLGAGPGRTFWRVSLPLASGGLAAGWALSFARGLGEFGATIIFAGNLQGVTQTLPLAIYSQFASDFDAALAIGGLLIGASALILLDRQTGLLVDHPPRLALDLDLPRRSFRLTLALEVGAETVAVVGPSGSGKSSLLRAVAGLDAPRARAHRPGRPGAVRLRAAGQPAARATARGPGVPGVRALPPHVGARQRGLRPAGRGRASCWSACASATWPTRARPSCRAASASASPWRARSRASRRCCCSTSRWRPSTPTRARRCAGSCASCWPSSACPRCW